VGEPSANPIRHVLPSQLRAREESRDDLNAMRSKPAKPQTAITPAQNPEIRDHFPCSAG
jgi:hypothetical protein